VEHVLFTGESFFVPIFLLYSGMITDPSTLAEGLNSGQPGRVVGVTLGVIFVAYVSKLAAAWITSRIYHYTPAEFWTAYGLSHAQAAVTIPTLVIGLQTGLFDRLLFNAAILMILMTSITSPMLVQRFARRLTQAHEAEDAAPLFGRVLVPIANPQTQEHLISLANLLARSADGKVMVLNVAQEVHSNIIGLDHQRELLQRVEMIINDPESSVELIPRIETSFARGILHTAAEKKATLIILGWRGKRSLPESIMGSLLDEVIWGTNTPVMVGKLIRPINSTQNVILVLPPTAVALSSLRRLIEANFVLARALNVPLIVLADSSYSKLAQDILQAEAHDQPCELVEINGQVKNHLQSIQTESDLVVVPSIGSRKRFISSIGGLPEQLAATLETNLLILHFER